MAALATLSLALFACHHQDSGSSSPDRLPDAAALIPNAPASAPTPTPSPGTLPEDEPLPATPGDAGGGSSSACGDPTPPPVSRVNVKVHLRQPSRMVLDSTPLVGPDVAYCRLIGYTDGRSFCPVRPEGDPERESCEATLVGRAADTGRFGPTWSANGRACDGSAVDGSCQNHPDNQYLAFAYGSGRFQACTAGGVCGEVTLP
jgi:hypothetical protein